MLTAICPKCGLKRLFPEEITDHAVACKCGTVFRLRAAAETVFSPQALNLKERVFGPASGARLREKILVECPACSTVHYMPLRAAGREAKCICGARQSIRPAGSGRAEWSERRIALSLAEWLELKLDILSMRHSTAFRNVRLLLLGDMTIHVMIVETFPLKLDENSKRRNFIRTFRNVRANLETVAEGFRMEGEDAPEIDENLVVEFFEFYRNEARKFGQISHGRLTWLDYGVYPESACA